ncbi:MAG: hypothetical protein M1827_007625 [Pycnora praestabilis]|nr:MAG: hypothetical protein M1827_007625 [Pycnora praestabilis]
MASVQNQARPHSFNNQGFLPNGASGPTTTGPSSGAGSSLLPNNGRVVQNGGVRVLCVADVRGSQASYPADPPMFRYVLIASQTIGNLRSLNELARQARAEYVIHTGDFGFYDESSLERIADKTLKHVAQYSPLLSEQMKRTIAQAPPQQPSIKQRFSPDQLPLSELSLFLNKTYSLDVPVFTVWGACEDVRVLEKFRSGEYKVNNLNIIDEANSRLLDVGGVKLRLLGLGGAVVMHKLFDNGEGRTTIAGGQGTMWTTLLQMGELVDTANRVYDPTETRVFVTHASPAREGLLNQLSVTLKADFSISAGLHFRYGSSYNEFSVNPTLDHYRGKLAASKASFNDVWETVKGEVEPAVAQNEAQQTLLTNALDIVQKMPTVANGGNPFGGPVGGPNAGGQVDESAFKNMWNFNLADAAFGWLVLEVDGGRIGTEMRAQGFNFAHRGGKHGVSQPVQASAQSPVTVSATPITGNASGPVAPSGPAQSRPAPVSASPVTQQTNQDQGQRNQPTVAPQQSPQPQPQSQPQQQQQPPQQTKPPTGPARTGPSPAPAVPSQPVKPATPQPTTNVNLPTPAATEKSVPPVQTNDVRNGTAQTEKAVASPAPKTASPVEKKPSTGLFISNVDNEQLVREVFSEEDRAKIQKIDRFGRAFVTHFSSPEEMKGVFDRYKKSKDTSQPGGPIVKVYEDRGPRQPYNNNRERDSHAGESGAGRWQGSARGGANAGGPQAGYRSGGASDSEGGRGGRGGFARGRGRGGERGRGRGGRGSFNNKTAGEGASPAPAAAAAPSGGES